jgi:chromosome segregation ATPase
MDAVGITSIAAIVVAVIGTIVIPVVLKRRQDKDKQDEVDVLSWKGITRELREDRDAAKKDAQQLQMQLNEIDERYRRQMKEQETDWEGRLAVLKQRVRELEEEVQTLKRLLRGGSDG